MEKYIVTELWISILNNLLNNFMYHLELLFCLSE
jgi:hypothetical protein